MCRRDFLARAAAATVAFTADGLLVGMNSPTPKVRIQKIETFPVLYPLRGRFKFFDGPPGRPAGRPAVVIKVTADDGRVGWGQSVPIPKWSYETVETVVSTIEKYLGPEICGRDPFDIDGLHKAMNQAIA